MARGQSFRGRGQRGGHRRGPPRKKVAIGRLRDETDDAPDTQHQTEPEPEPEEASSEEDDEESEDNEQEDPSAQPLNAYQSLLQSLKKDKAAETRKRARAEAGAKKVVQLADEPDSDSDEEQQDQVDDSDENEQDPSNETTEPDGSANLTPFNSHTCPPAPVSSRIKAIKENKYHSSLEMAQGTKGKWIIYTPDTGSTPPEPVAATRPDPQALGIKAKLLTSPDAEAVFAQKNAHEHELLRHIVNYRDVLYGNRTVQNAHSLRRMLSLHILNHIHKTRDRVLRTNERISRQQQDAAGASADVQDDDIQDQGFTRPKVLLLMETRNNCAKWVDILMSINQPEQQENKKRFQDSFVDTDQKFSPDRPADFRELFEGNDDNDFRVGIKFTRKTVKFFSQFYQSDIIIASPLGLRRAIEHPGKSKKEDSDFLSSIEILAIDQGDALAMQNWDHVDFILSHLNQQPKQSHDTDFSRIRPWYLDGESPFYRQTIALSAYITPELNGPIFNSHMRNHAGKVKYKPHYPGLVDTVATGLNFKQTFTRFRSASPWEDPDDRFELFKDTVLPWIEKTNRASTRTNPLGLLLFVPVYADWLRVRNHFSFSLDQTAQSIPYGLISEYSEPGDIQRARTHFQDGRISVLIYSGRAHHFRRNQIKGVKRVVMYGLPENPVFYSEFTERFIGRTISEGQTDASLSCSAHVLYSQWDILKLERVVGSDHVKEMVAQSSSKSFEFL